MMPHDHSNMLVELDSLCLTHKKCPPPPLLVLFDEIF